MKQIHKTIPTPTNPYIQHYFSHSELFFDIETTGFSPKYAFVYLIGMAFQKENHIHIYQFLAQTRSEEPEILKAFHDHLTPGQTLITFNGLGFDIPFLKAREALHSLPCSWDSFQFTDLYKLTAKLSRLFGLPDKKQKSVERFLGIRRDDQYTGGELIDVYHKYEKQQDAPSEALLLLHNYEDVLGMTKLLPLLSYRDLFEYPAHLLQTQTNILSNHPAKELILTIEVPIPFPKPCAYQKPPFRLTCESTSAELAIPILTGELKYYYDNYKDYYYLPEEDTILTAHVSKTQLVYHPDQIPYAEQ